ncbi:MAG: OmpA family protein [Stellaceae bacterium]
MTRRASSLLLALAAAILASCTQSRVVLLDSGKPSAVTIRNDAGVQRLDRPGEAVELSGRDSHAKPIAVSRAEIDRDWADAIAVHPPVPVTMILYFRFDTAELMPASRTVLPDILALVRQRPAPEIAITGYTDRSGEAHYNYDLGLKRAEAMRDAIEARGVSGRAITIDSYGAAHPLVEGRSPFEPRNRRVEITIR